MGPVATKMQLEKDESMVQRAVSEGAAVLCGGARPQLAEFPDGYFYQPTIVHQAGEGQLPDAQRSLRPGARRHAVHGRSRGARAGQRHRVRPRRRRLDARRPPRRTRWRARLEAGTVWVNTYRALTFNSPFGGYKASGIGRQNGIEAVYQYLQTKSVWCELGDEVQDPFVMKV